MTRPWKRDRYVIKVLCRLWLLNSAEIWAGTACNQSMTKKDSVSIVQLRKRLTKCTIHYRLSPLMIFPLRDASDADSGPRFNSTFAAERTLFPPSDVR